MTNPDFGTSVGGPATTDFLGGVAETSGFAPNLGSALQSVPTVLQGSSCGASVPQLAQPYGVMLFDAVALYQEWGLSGPQVLMQLRSINGFTGLTVSVSSLGASLSMAGLSTPATLPVPGNPIQWGLSWSPLGATWYMNGSSVSLGAPMPPNLVFMSLGAAVGLPCSSTTVLRRVFVMGSDSASVSALSGARRFGAAESVASPLPSPAYMMGMTTGNLAIQTQSGQSITTEGGQLIFLPGVEIPPVSNLPSSSTSLQGQMLGASASAAAGSFVAGSSSNFQGFVNSAHVYSAAGSFSTQVAYPLDRTQPDFRWTQSLPVTFASADFGPFRGTEVRVLQFLNGSLYAANGDWADPQLNNPSAVGTQGLRLDSAAGTWQVEEQFNELMPSGNRRYSAIGAMMATMITTDYLGNPVGPIELVTTGMFSAAKPLEMFQRVGAKGTPWNKVVLVPAANVPSTDTNNQVRSFGQHVDSVTGVQTFFAGTNPFGIFSGTYSASTGTVSWSTAAETGSTNVCSNSPNKGTSYDRVMAFAEAAGSLWATVYDSVVVRHDGPSPYWQKIWEYPLPIPVTGSSGWRGLTTVPNTQGPGDMLLMALNNNPLQMWTIQITPPYAVSMEFDITNYLTNLFGITMTNGIAGYNNMTWFQSGTQPPCLLIGITINAGGFDNPYGAAYPTAMYFVRYYDGTYSLRYISDPSLSPVPPLQGTRTIAVSEFPDDPPGTVYAGGLDYGFVKASLNLGNTNWLYRGTLI